MKLLVVQSAFNAEIHCRLSAEFKDKLSVPIVFELSAIFWIDPKFAHNNAREDESSIAVTSNKH
jgi:hypothetical protein